MTPKVACLCPTYGRPTLLANAAACFLAQRYDPNKLQLYILDDAGQFDQINSADGHVSPIYAGPFDNILLASRTDRCPSLTEKYQLLIAYARFFDPDIYLVWDDDDVYLPDYIPGHVQAQLAAANPGDDTGSIPLKFTRWSHPNPVWSDYSGSPQLEASDGRFHGSLGIGKHLMRQLGGWPPTRRADFDQQMIKMCRALGNEPLNPNDPDFPGPPPNTDLVGCDRLMPSPPQYIFRWGSTKANHCQGLMTSPQNEDWYDRYKITEPGFVGKLVPRFDSVAERYYQQFGYTPQIPSGTAT